SQLYHQHQSEKKSESNTFQTSSTPTKSDRPKSRHQDKVKIITTPWTKGTRTSSPKQVVRRYQLSRRK
ncbi:hypothetical protein BDV30DRAFT_220882, partial [Aspergillus minisclerotigenes]